MKLGIDQLNFYTSAYYLDTAVLAAAKKLPEDSFYHSLGQRKISIIPPNEDIVTLGANAADPLLSDCKVRQKIGLVIFATESAFDTSKAAASYLHSFFNLPSNCRIIELKQACYAGTFGLFTGLQWLVSHPDQKVLLVASDIARYPIDSRAEVSQGGGAVAMLLSQDPRLLEVNLNSGVCTRETLDFWHPLSLPCALVDGHLSCEAYLKLLISAFEDYKQKTHLDFAAHQGFCFHTPIPKLVRKGYNRLLATNEIKEDSFLNKVSSGLVYSEEIGNCYTASLYLGLLSWLANQKGDNTGKLLGCYSYGSGSIGEFFGVKIQENYLLAIKDLNLFLKQRKEMSYEEYLTCYRLSEKLHSQPNLKVNEEGFWQHGRFYLQAVDEKYRRIYQVGE